MGSTAGCEEPAGHPSPFFRSLLGDSNYAPGGRRQAATHLEVGELGESLFTARMRALVGSVTCVDSAKGSPMRWSSGQIPRGQLQPRSPWLACSTPLASKLPRLPCTPFPQTEPQQELGTSKAIPCPFPGLPLTLHD